MCITGIGEAALELCFKVGPGNHQRVISPLQKFLDIFSHMRLVPLKMTSHLTNHNFAITESYRVQLEQFHFNFNRLCCV